MQIVLARRISMSGPPERLDTAAINLAAGFFSHFARTQGHLGGHAMVDRRRGAFSVTSFWDSLPPVEESMDKVRKAAQQISETIWGSAGTWAIETFEVVGLVPCQVSLEMPRH